MPPPNERQGFTPIANPYFTGVPVSNAEMFFGREENFKFARRRLEVEKGGIVLVFEGERRSGKSSILFQIRDGRLGNAFLPILIDMQAAIVGEMDDRGFFAYMAERTCEQVGDARIVSDHYDFSQGNPTLAFDRLLDDIRQVFPDRRLIFLLDETELLLDKVIGGELSGTILTYMASILESRRVSFFFTGSAGLGEKEDESWRLLIGKAWRQKISFLDRADALRLITKPVEGKVFYGEGVVEAIYRLTFGHPHYTQYVCTNVVDYLNSVGRNRLMRGDLDEIIQTILDNPPPSMIYTWDGLTREEQITLSLLSEQGDGEPAFVHPETLAEAIEENQYPLPDTSADALHIQMEDLYQRDLLERNAEGAYAFRMDLFRRWIRRSRSIWQLMEDVRPKKSKTPLLVGIGGAVLVLLVVVVLWMRGPSEEERLQAQLELLTPTTGELVVESVPSGAEVFINGQKQSKRTPTLVRNLASGIHVVGVRMEGYRVRQDSVAIEAGTTTTRTFALSPLTGRLWIRSSPPSARIILNGEERGVTPLELERPIGEYALEVIKEGYVAHRESVTVTEDDTQEVQVDLIARVGSLKIVSNPPGATIFLDDREQSQRTPAPLKDLEVRDYRLRLEKPDYLPVDTTVSVELGRTRTFSFPLRLLPAMLNLASTPPGAAIYVDDADTARGRTPWVFQLTPDTHRIRLVLEGYEDYPLERTFLPGEKAEEHPRLKPQYGYVRVVHPLFKTIIIEGRGETKRVEPPVGQIPLQVGRYRIKVEGHAEGMWVNVAKDDTTKVSLP